GSVTAERDEQIRVLAEIAFADAVAAIAELVRRGEVDADFDAALAQILDDFRRVLEGNWSGRFRRDSDRADLAHQVVVAATAMARRTSSGSMTMRSPARSGQTNRIGWTPFPRGARGARAPSRCLSAALAISRSASCVKSS